MHQENGSTVAFTQTANGGFTPVQPRMLATLVNHPDGSYTFTRQGKQVFAFTAAGHLGAVSDLNGNSTTLAYDGSGNLASITDSAGHCLTVTTSGVRITQITDPPPTASPTPTAVPET